MLKRGRSVFGTGLRVFQVDLLLVTPAHKGTYLPRNRRDSRKRRRKNICGVTAFLDLNMIFAKRDTVECASFALLTHVCCPLKKL
jgi:hypothetical protein